MGTCVLLIAAGCGSASVAPASAQVLEQYGLTPTGPTVTDTIEIGDIQQPPWALYLEVSREIGLDFSDLSGATAELQATPIVGGRTGASTHVLVVDGVARGAWLSSDDMSGVLPLSMPP